MRVVSAPTPYVGASVLVEAYGLGGLVPNTVLLGDRETTSDPSEYATMVRRLHDAGRNVIAVRADEGADFGERRSIDVWLSSIRDSGALMITLANTLRSSLSWRRATLTIRMIVTSDEAVAEVATNVQSLLAHARLVADVDVIADTRPAPVVISERSGRADLTLIGLPDPCQHPDDFAGPLDAMLSSIQTSSPTAFVLASNDVDLEALLQ